MLGFLFFIFKPSSQNPQTEKTGKSLSFCLAEKEGLDFAVPVFLFACAGRFGAKIRPLQLQRLAASVPASFINGIAVVYHQFRKKLHIIKANALYIIIAEAFIQPFG